MKFVILDHLPPKQDCDSTARTLKRHFDIMFEFADGKALRTFAAEHLPCGIGEAVEATVLADHRLAYLDYEGPVSDSRGAVQRYARGTWNGKLMEDVVLSFDTDSNNLAGQSWSIRFHTGENRQLKLFRIA